MNDPVKILLTRGVGLTSRFQDPGRKNLKDRPDSAEAYNLERHPIDSDLIPCEIITHDGRETFWYSSYRKRMIEVHTISNTVAYGGPSEGQAACGSILECLIAQTMDPSVLGTTVLGLLLVSIAIGHLTDAIDVVESELQRTIAEQTAFEEFADRVATMDVRAPRPPSDPEYRSLVDTDAGHRDRIIDAYRDTVMSVPHFECEYDESLEQNMAGELGEEVTLAVIECETISSPIQQVIVTKAQEAGTLRGQFVDSLQAELDDLRTTEKAVSEITGQLDELNPVDEYDENRTTAQGRLEELENRCESMLETRQKQIHEEPINRRVADWKKMPNLQEYLYRSMPVTYPVLHTVTDVLNEIRTSQRIVP